MREAENERVSDAVRNLVVEFLAGEQSGLLLVCPPTGSGKSRAIRELMAAKALGNGDFLGAQGDPKLLESVLSELRGKKIIYLTPLKKNLPDIQELAELTGKDEKFIRRNVLNLIPNTEGISRLPEFEGKEKLKKFRGRYAEDYREVLKQIEMSEKIREKPELYTAAEKEFFSQELYSAERRFREDLKTFLKKEMPDIPEANLAREIRRENSPWHWVGELYPAVYLRITPVILLSTDKFYYTIDPIIGTPFRFSDEDCRYTDGAVIVFDEFDDSKKWILDSMIADAAGEKRKMDLISIFTAVYYHLTAWEKSTPYDRWMSPKVRNILDQNRTEAQKIWKDYRLDKPYKTRSEKKQTASGFYYTDSSSMLMIDADGNPASIRCVPDENTNWITVQEGGGEKIQKMLGKLESFLRYFETGMSWIARDFLRYEKEMEEIDIPYADAVLSVLRPFDLGETESKILQEAILSSRRGSRAGSEGLEDPYRTLELYGRGFSYVSMEDDTTHSLSTAFMHYSLRDTPEMYLLSLCRRAKVIGLSATGTLETIRNFDLDFLERELGEHFHSPENGGYHREKFRKAYDALDRAVDRQQRGYESQGGKIRPEAAVIPEVGPRKRMNELLGGPAEELCSRILKDVEGLGRDENYALRRYSLFAYCYREFADREDVDSFLYVSNRLPRAGTEFDPEVLKEICRDISGKDDMLYILDNNEGKFEEKLKTCREKLESGAKLFVISSYRTIGSGQNLQYRIPDRLEGKLLSSDGEELRGDKDFDAVYVEKPAYVLELLNDPERATMEDLFSFLMQISYSEQYAEISRGEKREAALVGFRRYCTHNKWKKDSQVLEKIGKSGLITQQVIQAVGRICRTNAKREHPRIYADPALNEMMAPTGNLRLTPENEAILLALSKENTEKQKENAEEEAAIYRMKRGEILSWSYVRRLLDGRWTEDSMTCWTSLRDLVLRYPQPDEDSFSRAAEEEQCLIRRLYIDRGKDSTRPKVHYRPAGDQAAQDFSVHEDSGHPASVSEESTRLSLLLQNLSVREYFEESGYARSFCRDAQYVMPPSLAHNIYMGALGEQAGLAILRDHLPGLELEPIEEEKHFEFLDFRAAGLPVYVDFKNWSRSLKAEKDELRDRTAEKSAQIPDCEYALIINVLAGEDAGDTAPLVYPLADPKQDREIRIVLIPTLLNPENPAEVDLGSIRYLDSLRKEMEKRK